ncbi:hypothetical protein ACFSR6_19315 [Pedobacter vanadiisoli]|uniref:Immunity protein 26 of polymorphic toxin system n=1 Tax=Pedobacter vanadiisoli TaxID=1761975 RepID=A0ABW5MMX6_9SPHI
MYKNSLLPKPEYVPKISTECLIEYGDFYVIRWAEGEYNDLVDELGFARSTVFITTIPPDQKIIELPGLSVNLLCKESDEESTSYRAIGRAIPEWDRVEYVESGELESLYEKKDGHINFFIRISDIHQTEFDLRIVKQPDTIKNLKGREFIEKNEFDKEGKEISVIYTKGGGIFQFVHTPNLINYWHFELHCIIGDKTVKRSTKSKTDRSSLELALVNKFTWNTSAIRPEGLKILDPETCYKKAV